MNIINGGMKRRHCNHKSVVNFLITVCSKDIRLLVIE